MTQTTMPSELESALLDWINDLLRMFRWQSSHRTSIHTREEYFIAEELNKEGLAHFGLETTRRLIEIAETVPEFWTLGTISNDEEIESEDKEAAVRLVLENFATAYVSRSRGPLLNEDTFNDLVAALDQFLYSADTIQWVSINELFVARNEADALPFELLPGMVIRRSTTADEQASIRTPSTSPFDFVQPSYQWADTVIEVSGAVGEFDDLPPLKDRWAFVPFLRYARSEAQAVLLGLRLLHSGTAKLGARRLIWKNPLLRGYDEKTSSYREPDHGEDEQPYILTDGDLQQLNEFWAFLQDESAKRKELDIAIARFSTSFSRETEVDRYIDLWIALESLFSPEGSTEISHRMCQNLARYIGDNVSDRMDIYSNAKKAYGVRSAVVHGRKPAGAANVERQIDIVDRYLRRALLRCLHDQCRPNHDQLLQDMFV